jgi:hypothetical protein
MRGTGGGGVSMNGMEFGRAPGVLGAGMLEGGAPISLTPTLERRGGRRIALEPGAGMEACAPLMLWLRLLALLRLDAALMLDCALAALTPLAALMALATDVADADCCIWSPPMPGAGPRPRVRGPVPCIPRMVDRSGRSPRSSTLPIRECGRIMSERDGGRMSVRDDGRMSERDGGRMLDLEITRMSAETVREWSARDERPETDWPKEVSESVGLSICEPIEALRDGPGIKVGLMAPLRLDDLVCVCEREGGRGTPPCTDCESELLPADGPLVETVSGGRPERRVDLCKEREEAVGVWPGDPRWLRERCGARGEGIPGRLGSMLVPTPRVGSRGEDGSCFRCEPGRAGGVSSGSDNITQDGDRMLELPPVGVTFVLGGGFDKAATRVCCAFAAPDEPVVALGRVLLRGGRTLRFGMRAPKRSSVALRRV